MWTYIGLMVSAFGSNKAFREIKKNFTCIYFIIIFLLPLFFIFFYNPSKAFYNLFNYSACLVLTTLSSFFFFFFCLWKFNLFSCGMTFYVLSNLMNGGCCCQQCLKWNDIYKMHFNICGCRLPCLPLYCRVVCLFNLCLLQELPTGSKVGIDPWLITHGKILASPIVQL